MLETVRSFQNLRKHNFRQDCGFSLCAYGVRIPPRIPFAYACVYPAYGPIQNFLASQPLQLLKGCACDAYPSPRLVLLCNLFLVRFLFPKRLTSDLVPIQLQTLSGVNVTSYATHALHILYRMIQRQELLYGMLKNLHHFCEKR